MALSVNIIHKPSLIMVILNILCCF